jgi:hypothetical protein
MYNNENPTAKWNKTTLGQNQHIHEFFFCTGEEHSSFVTLVGKEVYRNMTLPLNEPLIFKPTSDFYGHVTK